MKSSIEIILDSTPSFFNFIMTTANKKIFKWNESLNFWQRTTCCYRFFSWFPSLKLPPLSISVFFCVLFCWNVRWSDISEEKSKKKNLAHWLHHDRNHQTINLLTSNLFNKQTNKQTNERWNNVVEDEWR